MRSRIGKFLAAKRVHEEETMVDMAEKLQISTAYLSSIENGKREVPNDFGKKIKDAYHLIETEQKELENAIILSKKVSKIDLTLLSDERRELSLCYARKIQNLSDEKFEKLREILEEDE
ncbi:helix-turn-helix domain-containing protein [Fusobacterium necrophorum subsp. funduliforme]|uniref:helix-turn-helix domain-containing protein n=1 Tax=Fusobacterium necrophorum TaxID=859 RepID=UPI00370F050E